MRHLVAWRLNEPGEGSRRWSRAHRVVVMPTQDVALCGVKVPEFAYDKAWDEHVTGDIARCERCYQKWQKELESV